MTSMHWLKLDAKHEWNSVQSLTALKNNGSEYSWSDLNNILQIFQAILSPLPQPNHLMIEFHDFI